MPFLQRHFHAHRFALRGGSAEPSADGGADGGRRRTTVWSPHRRPHRMADGAPRPAADAWADRGPQSGAQGRQGRRQWRQWRLLAAAVAAAVVVASSFVWYSRR